MFELSIKSLICWLYRGMIYVYIRNEWWQNLQEDFKRLNQSYQDYYRDFYSPESQKSMRSAAFIIHKKQFISYLQDFIQELQSCVVQMETLLNALTADKIDIALEQVVSSELEIPRPQSEQHELLEEKLRGNVKGKWQAIANWFSGEKSTAKEVLEVTNEVIRHIVQNAALLVQMQNVGVSKKAEYIKFLALFHNCKTMQEAHCLSAYVFGVQQVRHFIINDARSADSITSSIYEEKPMEFPIRPRVRTYKPRIDRSGFQDKSAEKVEAQKRVVQEQQRLREEVFKHIKKGKLDFSDLEELVSPEVRSIFLGWIAGANMDAEKRGTTEYGQVFSLKRDGNKSCCMRCTDGELMMPAYVLVFEGDSYA